MYPFRVRHMPGLLLATLLTLACDADQPETAPAEDDMAQDALDAPAATEHDELDCSWSDAVEATEALVWVPEPLDMAQGLVEGLPPWAPEEDVVGAFPIGTWDVELVWHDGAVYTASFSLEEIGNFRYLEAETESDEGVLLVDGVVQIMLPEAGLLTTREVTIYSRYSEFIWSMGGLITAALAEQVHCEQALLYHTRYSFQGPTEGLLVSEDHETGLQALQATQPW